MMRIMMFHPESLFCAMGALVMLLCGGSAFGNEKAVFPGATGFGVNTRAGTDGAIIRDFEQRSGRIIESQEEVGRYPKHQPVKRVLQIPNTNRRQWLAQFAD